MIKTEIDTLNFDEKVELFVDKFDLYYFDKNGNRIEDEKHIQSLFELINDKESLNEEAI